MDSGEDDKTLSELSNLQSSIQVALMQKDKFNDIQARISEWFIKYVQD